jgi:uncharacterized protein (DUF1800 family)
MKASRRSFLRLAGLASMTASLSGCERITSEISNRMDSGMPESLPADMAASTIDPIFHLLSRAGFGPRPGEVEQAKAQGAGAWLEQQLEPDKIDDGVCTFRSRRFETMHLDPGTCYEFKKPVLRDELIRYSLLRAIYSKRQLFENMVEFWSDHLNIYIEKGDCVYLKGADDRKVVRAHALGKFHDLIRQSATSPAMLVYLDGNENKVVGADGIPNENYARELLELHTLGIHGGYKQDDVFEIGRCLSGWRLHSPWQRAVVYFDETCHDQGEKHVLGQVIPAGGGAEDLERVIAITCDHPSTARHIATKLVQRFVADEPPASLVAKVAAAFTRSGGDIKSMLRTVFHSEEFARCRGNKFKRPVRYIVSALRMLDADTYAHTALLQYLIRMGQEPYQHPTPDGYCDIASHWCGNLLWRWNFALALPANRIKGVAVPLSKLASALGETERSALSPARLFSYLVGRGATSKELLALEQYVGGTLHLSDMTKSELVGLVLASPAFQRY